MQNGLSASAKPHLDDFIAGLGDGDVQLYVGPLEWQDGTSFLAAGERATDVQIWYAEQLLRGHRRRQCRFGYGRARSAMKTPLRRSSPAGIAVIARL